MRSIAICTIIAAAAAFAACGGTSENKPANTTPAAVTTATARPMANPPTKEAIMALEKSAMDAWKNKDAKFWDSFLTDNFVALAVGGRLDRAAAIKLYSGAGCNIKSFSLTDDQMTTLGADAVLITYKAAIDGTCGGAKVPAQTWIASAYIRSGDKWKGAFHGEAPVVDPNAPPVKGAIPTPSETPMSTEKVPTVNADPSVLALEKKIWDAWKNKDAKTLEDTLANDYFFMTSGGRADRAGMIKVWATNNKCDIKSVELFQPLSVALTADAALLTYRGGVEGLCEGNAVPAQWFAALDVKQGDTWRPAFGMGF